MFYMRTENREKYRRIVTNLPIYQFWPKMDLLIYALFWQNCPAFYYEETT